MPYVSRSLSCCVYTFMLRLQLLLALSAATQNVVAVFRKGVRAVQVIGRASMCSYHANTRKCHSFWRKLGSHLYSFNVFRNENKTWSNKNYLPRASAVWLIWSLTRNPVLIVVPFSVCFHVNKQTSCHLCFFLIQEDREPTSKTIFRKLCLCFGCRVGALHPVYSIP